MSTKKQINTPTKIFTLVVLLLFILISLIRDIGGPGIVFMSIENGLSTINDDETLTIYMDSPAEIIQQEIYSSDFITKYIPMDIHIAANSEFTNLSDEEKYDVMTKAVFHIREHINNSSTTPYFNTSCGQKYFMEYHCKLNNLIFTNGTNSYTFGLTNLFDPGFLTLNINGTDVYPSEEDVYNFMERKYNELTYYENAEYVDSYVYKESIFKLVDLKFNISKSDAEQIFEDYGDYDSY